MDEMLYTRDVLRLAASLDDRRLDAPDVTVARTGRPCGSRLTLDLRFDAAGRIAEAGMAVKACALGQASAAYALARLTGQRADTLAPVERSLRAMLAGEAAPLDAADWRDGVGQDWSGLGVFAPVAAFPARHGAVLLPFDAVRAAFDMRQAA
ncbi:hypothetical protein CCR80_04395 [Rhodothalassium salexigens]|uniref:iron-sulfur cluster assembly scaffold protein n=1 Tax=Rhodothalassium salexigens TaxID=1086 RepID=UPI0019125F4A|nr:iron-sulfur cluster assembly scaffold protein [Rhodothalassium salexigens]MBK5920279.1 hypothetical protein [Rhodothalassium salexigens]